VKTQVVRSIAILALVTAGDSIAQKKEGNLELICVGTMISESSLRGTETQVYREVKKFENGQFITRTMQSGSPVTISVPCVWSESEIKCSPEPIDFPPGTVARNIDTGGKIDRRTGTYTSHSFTEYTSGHYVSIRVSAVCDLPPKKRF